MLDEQGIEAWALQDPKFETSLKPLLDKGVKL